jgi:predicted sugar kinase
VVLVVVVLELQPMLHLEARPLPLMALGALVEMGQMVVMQPLWLVLMVHHLITMSFMVLMAQEVLEAQGQAVALAVEVAGLLLSQGQAQLLRLEVLVVLEVLVEAGARQVLLEALGPLVLVLVAVEAVAALLVKMVAQVAQVALVLF